MIISVIFLLIAGTFVNGPYSLITTAVSADLGTRIKSQDALATVTAIIDGTGSLGAAIGPLLCGPLSKIGWGYVFIMIIGSNIFAMLSLLRVATRQFFEIKLKRQRN